MAEHTGRHEPDAIPSLIDDVTFQAELEALDLRGAYDARGIARPLVAPAPPVMPRDVNRWNLVPPPGVDPPERVVYQTPRARGAWMPILIGLGAGAAGSAALFHERLALLIDLLTR